MNEVVHRIGGDFPTFIEQLGVVGERQVSDVPTELPHVGRPEELLGRQLVDNQVTVAQGLHVAPSIRGGIHANRKSVRALL